MPTRFNYAQQGDLFRRAHSSVTLTGWPNAITSINLTSARGLGSSSNERSEQQQPANIVDILDREIKDELAELNQHLAGDHFPGFTVEATDADVKLTKQCGDATVTVRFTVSSSLNEWPCDDDQSSVNQQNSAQQDMQEPASQLVCMPDFQVQINKANNTLEMSCYFEEPEADEETGQPYGGEPAFAIDELVLYQGEPKETEYAVSAEYFQDDLQDALMQYLAEHGIDEEFGRNLIAYATSYEKKQYIGLMQRLKSFVTK